VNATLTGVVALPLEVFHHVGDVGIVAIDPRFLERAIEQRAGRTDERMARLFIVPPAAPPRGTRTAGPTALPVGRAEGVVT
jgi:hypothetical protein